MDLDGIRSLWKSYPKVTQRPPVELLDDREAFLAAHPWPLGMTIFESGPLGEKILLQGDRLAVEWDAELTDLRYPGYTAMKDLLTQRYDEFLKILISNDVQSTPVPQSCDCQYTNLVQGHSVTSVAFRLLTGQDASTEPLSLKPMDHFHAQSRWDDNEPAYLSVTQGKDAATRIVITVGTTSIADPKNWWEALDRCHEQAHCLFYDCLGYSA